MIMIGAAGRREPALNDKDANDVNDGEKEKEAGDMRSLVPDLKRGTRKKMMEKSCWCQCGLVDTLLSERRKQQEKRRGDMNRKI